MPNEDVRSFGASCLFSFVVSAIAALTICAVTPTKFIPVSPRLRTSPKVAVASA
jgi:hypothetical protein